MRMSFDKKIASILKNLPNYKYPNSSKNLVALFVYKQSYKSREKSFGDFQVKETNFLELNNWNGLEEHTKKKYLESIPDCDDPQY